MPRHSPRAVAFGLLFAASLLASVASAAGKPDAITWSFDAGVGAVSGSRTIALGGPGAAAKYVAGVRGSAIELLDGLLAYEVPGAFAVEGTLSFYYRLPAQGKGPRDILRLGEYALQYRNSRLYWRREGGGDDDPKPWVPLHSVLSEKEFVLVEVGWSAEQRGIVFANGRVACWMGSYTPPAQPPETVTLALFPGVFDEMRLEADATASGGRYKGVLFFDNFDAEKALDPEKLRRVPGFNGSPGAIATPIRSGRYLSMQVPLGTFRVTEDLYLCQAVYSSIGGVAQAMVRAWPDIASKHPNHWLRRGTPPGRWIAERIPIGRFGLPVGSLAHGVSFGNYTAGERWVAADDVCLIRGEDKVPPEKVPFVKATATDRGVRLSWGRAGDNILVVGYRVFWSNVPELELTRDEVVCETLDTEFLHEYIPHAGDWYYAVAAVDAFGNVGPPSDIARVRLAFAE